MKFWRVTSIAAVLALPACGGRTRDAQTTAAPDASPLDAAPLHDAGPALDAGSLDVAVFDAAPDVPQFPPCPIDPEPNSTVAGTTPDGPFNSRFAWLGKTEGECSSQIFVVLSEVSDMLPTFSFAEPSPPILSFSRRGSTQGGVALGAAESDFSFVVRDKRPTTVRGTVTLTYAEFPGRNRSPEARVEGNIELAVDGFAISGSFVAPYCGWMDVYCP